MQTQTIPDWLHREVDDDFAVPLPMKPATVADIGANVGAFALRAHWEWPEATVFCCEPMPFNVKRLRHDVSPDGCRVVPSAVRAGGGHDDIFIGDLFVTGGFRKGPRQSARTIRVSCVAAAELPSCERVKIDTEDCEVEILRGLDLARRGRSCSSTTAGRTRGSSGGCSRTGSRSSWTALPPRSGRWSSSAVPGAARCGPGAGLPTAAGPQGARLPDRV